MKSTAKVSWQLWRDRRGRLSPLRVGTLALLFFPLAKALVDAQSIVHGARPINDLIHRAGFWALVFLGVTLAVTPLRRIARYGNLIDVRRMLGVGAFCYIATHLTLFTASQMFDLGKVAHEISHRWYLIVGGTAWLGLGDARRDLDRRHGAPARGIALAAAASDCLWHRAAGADSLFPADQGRRHGAHFRRQPVPVADRLPAGRLVARHERIVHADAAGAEHRGVGCHIHRRGGRHRHRLPCLADARARRGVRFFRRHQAGLAGASRGPCRGRD